MNDITVDHFPRTPKTFYVIDFDQCIGNVPASYDGLMRVLERHSYDLRAFTQARADADKQMAQFWIVDYLQSVRSDTTVTELFDEFISDVSDPETMRETGATQALGWLTRTDRAFGIVSFGVSEWQQAKMTAAGLAGVPKKIVANPSKSAEVASWRDETGRFVVPVELRVDQADPGIYDRIVIVDDKAAAFDQADASVNGYWLQLRETLVPSQQGSVDDRFVTTIRSWDDFTQNEENIPDHTIDKT